MLKNSYTAVIADETIRFLGADVTSLGNNTYQINNVIRGVQKSEFLVNDRFVLLDSNIISHPIDQSLIGEDIKLSGSLQWVTL